MHNLKASLLVGFVTTLGIPALVGCGNGGGGGDAAPTLALTTDNVKAVASQALVGGDRVRNSPLFHFISDDTGAFRACAGGGTHTIAFSGNPDAGLNETVTYTDCIGEASTAAITGTLKLAQSGNLGPSTFSVALDITSKTPDSTLTETAELDLTSQPGKRSIRGGLTVALTGSKLAGTTALSNGQIDASSAVNPAITESFDLESSQLGGQVHVDTVTPLLLGSGEHPAGGQLAVTGAKTDKLVITILGDETFTPPAGQGQVKLELDGAAPVYTSWSDIDAGGGVLIDASAAPGTTSP